MKIYMNRNKFVQLKTREEYEHFKSSNSCYTVAIGKEYKYINGQLYDESNQRQHKDRFDFYISSDENELSLSESQKRAIKYIDKDIFIMNYNWGWNYHNMYYECLPQIYIYIELLKHNKDLHVSIPLNFLEMFKHIFLFLNLDSEMIIKEENFQCKTCMFSNFCKLYFLSGISLDMHPYHYKINSLIKDNLKYNRNELTNKLLYLSRRGNLAGKNRYIINDCEINNLIIENNGKITYLEDNTLQEKYNLVSNNETIITQVGANLVNLYFSDISNTKKIILLAPSFASEHYIHWNVYFLKKYTGIENIRLITGETIHLFDESHGDLVNQPFKINIQDVIDEL